MTHTPPTLRDILDQRAQTHGSFADNADISQSIKAILRDGARWHDLSNQQAEALDNIAAKMARAVNGSGDHLDHWADIAGYAQLVVDALTADATPDPQMRMWYDADEDGSSEP